MGIRELILVFVAGFVLALTVMPFARWFWAKRSAQKLGLEDRGELFNQWCLPCGSNLRFGMKKMGGGLVRWCASCCRVLEEDEHEWPQVVPFPPPQRPDLKNFVREDEEFLRRMGW